MKENLISLHKLLRTFILAFPNEQYSALYMADATSKTTLYNFMSNPLKIIYGSLRFNDAAVSTSIIKNIVSSSKNLDSCYHTIHEGRMWFTLVDQNWIIDTKNKQFLNQKSIDGIWTSIDVHINELSLDILSTFFAMILEYRYSSKFMNEFYKNYILNKMHRITS